MTPEGIIAVAFVILAAQAFVAWIAWKLAERFLKAALRGKV